MRSWRGTIIGQPYSKGNRRQWAGTRGFIKSAEAKQYAESARKQLAFVRAIGGLIEGHVKVTMTIHYRTWHSDLDESLILDVLQGYVYVNDRQVVHKDIRRGENDKKDPRAVIEIEEVT